VVLSGGSRPGVRPEGRHGAALGSCPDLAARSVVFDVELLLADGLGDLTLVGLDVLVEVHALLRDDALVGDGLLLVQDDLVLLG
jgi:hypothetical protein